LSTPHPVNFVVDQNGFHQPLLVLLPMQEGLLRLPEEAGKLLRRLQVEMSLPRQQLAEEAVGLLRHFKINSKKCGRLMWPPPGCIIMAKNVPVNLNGHLRNRPAPLHNNVKKMSGYNKTDRFEKADPLSLNDKIISVLLLRKLFSPFK